MSYDARLLYVERVAVLNVGEITRANVRYFSKFLLGQFQSFTHFFYILSKTEKIRITMKTHNKAALE